MADNNQSSNSALYFIVGALVVAVIGFAVWYFNGQPASGPDSNESDLSISVDDDTLSVDTPDE